MNGLVFYCSIGANIPCTSKADTERHRPDIDRYCRKERNWRFCADGRHWPRHYVQLVMRQRQGGHLMDQRQSDKQGFQARFWTPLLN